MDLHSTRRKAKPVLRFRADVIIARIEAIGCIVKAVVPYLIFIRHSAPTIKLNALIIITKTQPPLSSSETKFVLVWPKKKGNFLNESRPFIGGTEGTMNYRYTFKICSESWADLKAFLQILIDLDKWCCNWASLVFARLDQYTVVVLPIC